MNQTRSLHDPSVSHTLLLFYGVMLLAVGVRAAWPFPPGPASWTFEQVLPFVFGHLGVALLSCLLEHRLTTFARVHLLTAALVSVAFLLF